MHTLAASLFIYLMMATYAAADTYWVRLNHALDKLSTGLVTQSPDTANGPNEPILFMGQIIPNKFFEVPGTRDGNDTYIEWGFVIKCKRDEHGCADTGYEWAIVTTKVGEYFLVGSISFPLD